MILKSLRDGREVNILGAGLKLSHAASHGRKDAEEVIKVPELYTYFK